VQLYSPLVFNWFSLVFLPDEQLGPKFYIQVPPDVQFGETLFNNQYFRILQLNLPIQVIIIPL